ncbi:MAG: DUF4430 domain-containing protein [Ruminococcus sp.]|nr:DUF4430 domain-containing protein [Ruminococcus sp.]
MRIKRLGGFLCALLLFCTMLLPTQSNADTADDVQGIINGILQYEMNKSGADSVQEWIDGELTENAGITAEWYILALRQSKENYDFSGYSSALLRYLEENNVTSASTRQKYALVLHAVGSGDGYISETLGNSIGEQGLMSWVYGLHLLNNGLASETYTAESVISEILSLQLTDGGFAITGTVSDADVTAMTVQALAPHYPQYSAEIDRAVLLLSKRQQDDGGFASYGVPNPESASQVIMALSALGIDCMLDERFIKNGNTMLDGITPYRLANGSFSHTLGGIENHNATVQVFLALTAYKMQQNGGGSMFLFESSESSGVSVNPRLYITIAIVGAGAALCLILFLRKKRSTKRFVTVLLLTCAAIAIVWLTDLQSADNYYRNESPQQSCGSVTFSIRCDTVAGRKNAPENGEILKETNIPISKGDTVFDVLTRASRSEEIRMEYSGSTKMPYVEGIGDLYEFDFGDLSGWVYHVNGESPSVGCGECAVSDGDVIEWLYSLDLGNDVK